jgi:high-affinity iron transporter
MLPTFVIGLREGLEAALIVGIIAAFLNQQRRPDLLRWVFGGVTIAVLLCTAVGVTLNQLSKNLPQRKQEGLETVIGALAVGMVSYMIIWMRRNSRGLKKELEALAADALSGGSRAGRAMVLMAFLAVLREGLETVVFLLAAFNEAGSGGGAGIGAVLGVAAAVALGYGIYRGGVRLDLARFFRFTGLVLVLVAAGLVATAFHTAHEAGWLQAGQGSTINLSWLVDPGSIRSSLLTGMLGIQAHPVVIELLGWLVYVVPMTLYVAWPAGRSLSSRRTSALLAGLGAAAAAVALVAISTLPASAAHAPVTSAEGWTAQLRSADGDQIVVQTQTRSPAVAGQLPGPIAEITLHAGGSQSRDAESTTTYTATLPGRGAQGRPTSLPVATVAELNGGRLPLGAPLQASGELPVSYVDHDVLTVQLEPRTGRIVDESWTETVQASLVSASGMNLELAQPVARSSAQLPADSAAAASSAAHRDLTQNQQRLTREHTAVGMGVVAAAALVMAGALRRLVTPRHVRAGAPGMTNAVRVG